MGYEDKPGAARHAQASANSAISKFRRQLQNSFSVVFEYIGE